MMVDDLMYNSCVAEAIPSTDLTCTQCGGELQPDEGQVFLTCPFCTSTVYLDKSRVVFHWYLAATLDEAGARASLARWMAGNETVKDLDRKSQLTSSTFSYFPLWYFKRRQADGTEAIQLRPAAATSVTEIAYLRLTAGDLRKYDPGLDVQALPPTVPLQTALGWLQSAHIPQDEIVETALVHVPLYTFKYTFNGDSYTAVVEGASGQTLANIYPAKAETPYRLAGWGAALVFLCLATFPVIGALTGDMEGGGIGLLACLGIGVPAALLLFGLAAWVAAKV